MRLAGVASLLVALTAVSCSVPDSTSVWAHIKSRQGEYERLAQSWSELPHGTRFCYFRDAWYTRQNDEGYRWRDAFINRVGDGYQVVVPGGKLTAASLGEAAQIARIDEEQLLKWRHDFAELSVECMLTSNGYVELILGSEAVPYGVRYVPTDHEGTFKTLLGIDDGRLEPDDTRFVHLTGRWFYFRGSR